MSGHLLDTSVVIGASGSALPEAAAISVVTVGELAAGVRLARSAEVRAARAARLAAVRSAFAPIVVDGPVADAYGELLVVAREKRRTVKATDLLIIATAAAHGRRLHTLDHAQAGLAELAGVAVGAPA